MSLIIIKDAGRRNLQLKPPKEKKHTKTIAFRQRTKETDIGKQRGNYVQVMKQGGRDILSIVSHHIW